MHIAERKSTDWAFLLTGSEKVSWFKENFNNLCQQLQHLKNKGSINYLTCIYLYGYALQKLSHETDSSPKLRCENKQLGKRKGEKYPQRGEVWCNVNDDAINIKMPCGCGT